MGNVPLEHRLQWTSAETVEQWWAERVESPTMLGFRALGIATGIVGSVSAVSVFGFSRYTGVTTVRDRVVGLFFCVYKVAGLSRVVGASILAF